MQRVFLVPYDSRWADEYARESSAVANAIGNLLVGIHHIGSTAIPSIRAKPILDILADVTDVSLLDKRNARLEVLGYEALGEFGIAGRRYFRKDDCEGIRTHQIHAFQTLSPQIQRHLAFRDFLRIHPVHANRYDALKSRLAALHPNDITSYTDGKNAFIQEIDARAASWLSTSVADTVRPVGII